MSSFLRSGMEFLLSNWFNWWLLGWVCYGMGRFGRLGLAWVHGMVGKEWLGWVGWRWGDGLELTLLMIDG